ncbi:hypothetical protein HII31_10159 [Pseudocercospora fuligena]|uniref:Uncharacterized protein n=1 Tax=Pseudocercospora fuligena TaxID=685502 RepID=A0A8H6RDI6_9PEZI|nr:hypothetical protein HII31_10159 [Pseudocercospora fuligena]
MSAKSISTRHDPAQEGPAEADLNAREVYTRLRVIFYHLELDGVSHLNDEILDMVVRKAAAICRKDNESELLRVMSAIEKREGDSALYALLKKYITDYCRSCAPC